MTSIPSVSIALTTLLASLQAVEVDILCGSEISPRTKEISAFFNATYREAPYFYDASAEKWDGYVQSYADTEKAIVCIAHEGETILGIGMGTPLAKAKEKYRMGFASRPNELNSLFYLAEFAIKAPYRRQGIGTKMFQAFENAIISQNQFAGICFWQLESEETAPIDMFWGKQHFECRPDIHFEEIWKNVTGSDRVAHPMICWMKMIKK